MTTYTAISNGQIDQDSPITQPLMTAMRDNPLAIAERSTNAPYVESVWYPYNSDVVGDDDGVIYDFSVDGAVASVETPTFEAGYDYRLIIQGLSLTPVNPQFQIEAYRETSASYVLITNTGGMVLSTLRLHADFSVLSPYTASNVFLFLGSQNTLQAYSDAKFSASDGNFSLVNTTSQRISKMRVTTSSPGSTTFNAGKVFLLRRKVATT